MVLGRPLPDGGQAAVMFRTQQVDGDAPRSLQPDRVVDVFPRAFLTTPFRRFAQHQLDEVINGAKPCPVYSTDNKSRQQMSAC